MFTRAEEAEVAIWRDDDRARMVEVEKWIACAPTGLEVGASNELGSCGAVAVSSPLVVQVFLYSAWLGLRLSAESFLADVVSQTLYR